MGTSEQENEKIAMGTKVRNSIYMAINVSSSISIVMVNKAVFNLYGFQFGTTLTFFHFIATAIGVHLCALFKVFEVKKVDIAQVLPLVFTFIGFVVFTNLSLMYNSVGFYQVMKILTAPVIVVVNAYVYDTHIANNVKMSLVPVLVGVGIATVTDVQVNLIGSIYATLGVAVTSFYQIWCGQKQKNLQISSFQLLYYQAPLAALCMLVVVPIFESPYDVMAFEFTTEAVMMICLSCFLAFVVNLSIFLVIGTTSPVTYNVLGHFKTVVVLIGGVMIIGDPINPKSLVGVVLTLTGIMWYSKLKLDAMEKANKDKAEKEAASEESKEAQKS